MARWAAAIPSWTPVAVADTTNFTDNGHHTIQGGSGTQRGELREVYLGGQAGASSPTFMVVGRDSVVGGTLTSKFPAISISTSDIFNTSSSISF